MSVAVSIISAVLKSVFKSNVENELVNELIGISVDDVSEKGIGKINDFINNGRTKIEKILSEEKMKSMGISEDNIAYVIAEIKGLFSKIEITDEIFRQCKYDSLKLCGFLWEEYSESKTGHIEYESDIKKSLLAISDALIKLMCESEEFVKNISIQISNTVDDTRMEIQRISDYLKENFSKISTDNQRILDILREILEQNQKNKGMKKSRTQEYENKWNANMFLNNFDKRDESAGVNLKLSEIYLDEHLPHYVWGDNKNKFTDLKDLLTEYIEEHNDNKMLLVLGQPGIGKSTLITWITANFNERIDDILVYQIASDFGNIDWQNDRISNRILEEIGLNRDDLNGKILILDGFDEVSIESVRRRNILDSLYGDWIYNKTIENFSLIITCRENYIQEFAILKCKYITLQSWNEVQIKSFCSIFQEKIKSSISDVTLKKLLENKRILGIPLILYMVLALNISIEEEGSIVDVYDKIFSLEGGIYDRCIDNKSFADKHRIGYIKKQIHQMSREIAIWIFENNPNEAYIPQEEYKKICINIIHEAGENSKGLEQDFIIGNFFDLKHCEGQKGEELYFVHRSIYEYFVVETIYSSIENSIQILTDESQKELVANIVVYLKQGKVTNTIGEYLKHKISTLLNRLSSEKKDKFYDWWESAISRIMHKGMFYYTANNINYYENIINKECICFENILEISRFLVDLSERKYIMEKVGRKQLKRYIEHCLIENIGTQIKKEKKDSFINIENGKGLDLRKISLHKIDLSGANLSGANLSGANLAGANLSGANLSGAILCDVNLCDMNLDDVDIRRAVLEKSIWDRKNISKLFLQMTSCKFDFINLGINHERLDRNTLYKIHAYNS